MALIGLIDVPDISFSIHVPVFLWSTVVLVLIVGAMMILYWLIKAIVSVIMGG